MGFIQNEYFIITPKKRCKYICDNCSVEFYRTYKTRLAHNNNPWFCSNECSGTWKLKKGITTNSLFSKENRQIASVNRNKNIAKHKETIKKVIQQKYGVENVSQLNFVKEKKKKTVFSHYGVDHQWKNKEIREKIHETMKINGTYGKSSKGEMQLLEIFQKIFGFDNVQHLTTVNGREVDFYLDSINTYVQFDGVYWHGLDRPPLIIQNFATKRDTCIYRTFIFDKEQNLWFKNNNLKLARITDKDLQLYNKSNSRNRLRVLLQSLIIDNVSNIVQQGEN